MNLETKIELIRYQTLIQRISFNLETSFLIYELKDEINSIDEKTFFFDIEPQKDHITALHFIKSIDKYVYYVKSNIYNLPSLNYILKEIITGNKEQFVKLLNHKCEYNSLSYIKDDPTTKEIIYKIIIGNFIKNAKYIPQIEKFLNENKIKLKNIDDYNLKTCEKILKLLSNIVFCLRGDSNSIFLFENIDENLKEYLNRKKTSKSKENTLDKFHKKYIQTKTNEYEKMFKVYNEKKQFLKYFV